VHEPHQRPASATSATSTSATAATTASTGACDAAGAATYWDHGRADQRDHPVFFKRSDSGCWLHSDGTWYPFDHNYAKGG
jgi:hypothetical protein